MFKKVLGRSLGGTAVAGFVLTAAPLVAAPQITKVACGSYPSPIASQTVLTLSAAIAPYGAATTGKVKVTAGTASHGTPSGTVSIQVAGVAGPTLALNSAGEAEFALSRGLVARATYAIAARYSGSNCHNASSDQRFYTVTKAPTRVKPARITKRAARLGRFKAKVMATTGVVVRSGKVVFSVKQNGTVVSRKLGKVRKGVARVDGRNLGSGQYKVVMKYLGNGNFMAKKKAKSFRI